MIRRIHRPLLLLAVILVACLGAVLSHRAAQAQRPASVNIRLEANRQPWLDTAIDLAEGETVEFTVSGAAGWGPGVQVGPDGGLGNVCPLTMPEAPVGALLGRVGGGPPVFLGSGGTIAGPGRIALAYNDCPGQYFDNVGAFEVTFTFPAPVATPQPQAATQATVEAPVAPVVAPVVAKKDGGRFDPAIPLLIVAAAVVGVAAFYGRRFVPRGRVAQFSPTARLESSAWLAPVRLRAAQGERRPRRSLTVGGPDADVDFGLPGIWARLHPTEDGGARLEAMPGGGRILVDGKPLVMGHRLATGSRVFMGTREFIYRADAEGSGPGTTALNRRADALNKPDPRIAAMGQ
jgi:hypothetical protein